MRLFFEKDPLLPKQIAVRKEIESAMRSVIQNMRRLQIFQSTVWCGNICAMCSQWAASGITRIESQSILDIFAGIKSCLIWITGSQKLGELRAHKPGVIFPYLDNDCWSDPNLWNMIQILWEDFWCHTRISTVGYSRHNKYLQKMHEKIVQKMSRFVDGVRVSITPYTAHFFTEDYAIDIANILSTYNHFIKQQWTWRDTFACEVRYPPFIELWEVETGLWEQRFYIRSGSYCFLATKPWITPNKNWINGIHSRRVSFAEAPLEWQLFKRENGISLNMDELVRGTVGGKSLLYHLDNIDGSVYAVNPLFGEDGSFSAIHFLPKTESRKNSGILDSTRPFLNAMLEYKVRYFNIQPKNKLESDDIQKFMIFLQAYIQQAWYTETYVKFFQKEILPVIGVVAQAISLSSLENSYFFDPNFLVDTWHIVNQGRAKDLFQWLVSRNDEPITVNEMKWYGNENSIGSQRGTVYRIAPTPITWYTWMRNTDKSKNGLLVGWLHHKWLQAIPEETSIINMPIEKVYIPRSEIIKSFGIPGLSLRVENGIT